MMAKGVGSGSDPGHRLNCHLETVDGGHLTGSRSPYPSLLRLCRPQGLATAATSLPAAQLHVSWGAGETLDNGELA